MPVDIHLKQEPIYQRDQYDKGGIGRIYWDFRDKTALSFVDERHVRIVDVGCGEGITLERTGQLFPGKDVIGIDALEENLTICRAHHLKVIGGDVYRLPLSDESVDCVLFMEVIEHLDDPDAAIAEIHRVLRPRGRLVLVFPNDAAFKLARILTLRWKEAHYDPGHVRQWTPKTAGHLLSRHGFAVIGQRSIPFALWPLSLHHVMICDKEGK